MTRPIVPILAAALFAAAAPIQAQTSAATPAAPAALAAPDYAKDSSWLCLPGRGNVCSIPLGTTDLGASGYGASTTSVVAQDPPVDCFYVYPTVSRDPGLNSDLSPAEERGVAQTQFARLASVCRPFAPLYRQMTVGAVAAFSAGGDISGAAATAYQDVAKSFRNYLATRNGGRPFVLIGHSQGSFMLEQLIANEIEKNPAVAARMQVAFLAGFNVRVPVGKLAGGTFKYTPLCSRPGQLHCVIAWTSFRDKNVPPAGALFGVADQPGMTVGCVNPALPGSKDWAPLDSYWYARSASAVPGGPIHWSIEGEPKTTYVHTRGLVSAKCINDGARGYLSIRTNSQPGEKWTDHIGGEVGLLGMFLPGWGMHLSDVNEAQGDIVRTIGAISARSRTAVRR